MTKKQVIDELKKYFKLFCDSLADIEYHSVGCNEEYFDKESNNDIDRNIY